MDAAEIAERIQAAMMDAVTGDAGPDGFAVAIFEAVVKAADAADAAGIPLPAEVTSQVAPLREILAQLRSGTQLKEAVLDEAIAGILAATGGLPGSTGCSYSEQPDIFDAIEDGDVEAVRAALKDWDVNARHGEFDKTAPYNVFACSFTEVPLEIPMLLLDAGADPSKGLTYTNVLHGLGFGRHDHLKQEDLAQVIRRCVALGADLEEASDSLQWTPLHTALSEWNEVAVEALLMAGADPNARAGSRNQACTAGKSALEMVSTKPNLFALLLTYGADPNRQNAAGETAGQIIASELSRAEDSAYRDGLSRCQTILASHGATH